LFSLILLFTVFILPGCTGESGPRPDKFTYEPLDFTPPKPDDFRTVLSNGLAVYIAEDHEIPWFEAMLMMRTAPYLEPEDKLGVNNFTATVMRTGGTRTMSGEDINERMDFLAGSVSAANLSIHIRHIDEGMKIWMDILNNPAFPEDKLRREKESALTNYRNRNRNVSSVGRRTFNELVYGEDSPITSDMTDRTINNISIRDLNSWHKKYWGANNAILIVSGDFNKSEMLAKLESVFGKWEDAEKAAPDIPEVSQAAKAGVYMIQPQVIPNQGVIRIGHLGLMRTDPDYPAVDLMNYILGGGSFSSRIMKIVRSDNGLAYSTGSRFSGGTLFPGTKNSTVVFASQLMLNEIERMRDEPVTDKDLVFAKTARMSAFPAMFSSTFRILSNFARLEYNGQPMDYYDTYVGNYEKVTLEDISRVAQKYLQPENMIIMIAGNIEECRTGADNLLPNQNTIDAMAEKFGGRTIDGLAQKYGDGQVHIIELK
ncbi:M16 family metallopeptidase, partial [candidate division KSB1 bacterium]